MKTLKSCLKSRCYIRKGPIWSLDILNVSSLLRSTTMALLLMSFSIMLTIVRGDQTFTSLPMYDELHFDNTTTRTRMGNVDVLTIRGDNASSSSSSSDIALCHLAVMLSYSVHDENNQRIPYGINYHQGIAAILLAAEHLNTGDGSVVPEVSGLNERCNIRFTAEAFDTMRSRPRSIDFLKKTLIRRGSMGPHKGEDKPLPCAFIGAARSAVSIATAILTGVTDYPQFSASSTSTELDDKTLFPYFGRFIPSDASTARAALLYIRRQLNIQYLAILHVNDAYGNAYVQELISFNERSYLNMTFHIVPIKRKPSQEDMSVAIASLKASKLRWFFGITFPGHYNLLMKTAYSQGIAGTGLHNWIFADGWSISQVSSFKRESPLHLASVGVTAISALGGRAGMEQYDRFSEKFKAMNTKMDIDYIKSKFPVYPGEDEYDHPGVINDNFFEDPFLIPCFCYDIAIALGLAACDAAEPNYFLNGPIHYDAVLNTSFDGVTGRISLNNRTGTRTLKSSIFIIVNLVADENKNKDKNNNNSSVTFTKIDTDIFQNGTWRKLTTVHFNDGSSIPPPDLPENQEEMNYIGGGLCIVVATLCLVILFMSIGFSIWTHVNRKTKVVKASQPIFLHIICLGTFLMGSSIMFLGLDDEIPNDWVCDFACMAFPWLATTGFVVAFSALSTKIHRVNKIFHHPRFQRIKVTAWDVMKRMIILLGANITILTIWTVLDPLVYERHVVSTDEFGRYEESRGRCYSDSMVLFYSLLAVLDIGVLMYAVYEAYVARDIQTEFAESEYIYMAMGSILLVFFIGIPVTIIAKDNQEAFVFVAAGCIDVICSSLLLLIFIPKIIILRSDRSSQRGSSGLMILQHPKLQKDLQQEDDRLREEIKGLKQQNLELSQKCRAYEAVGSSLLVTDDKVKDGGHLDGNIVMVGISRNEQKQKQKQHQQEEKESQTFQISIDKGLQTDSTKTVQDSSDEEL